MFRKILAIVILMSLFCYAPVFAGEELVINGNFEGEEISFSNISVIQGGDGFFAGLLKSEGFADENGIFTHKSEYLHKINIEEGKMYEVSMKVAEDGGEGSGRVIAEYLSDNDTIVLNIEDAGNQLSEISTVFLAGKSGEVSVSISAFTKSRMGLLIDNISIKQSDKTPVGMEIIGTRNAFVPPYESEIYNYSAVAIDENGGIIPVISSRVEFEFLPDGVNVLGESGSIAVTNQAQTGETFIVRAVANDTSGVLPEKEIEVKLVDNYIENGDFEDYPSNRGFETELGNMEIISTLGGNVAHIITVAENEEEYKASIMVEKTYVLTPGKMYVLRAKAYSESGYTSRYATISKGELSPEGYIDVNISNIGDEDTEIVSVIKVPNEGIYKIRLNFTNPDGRSVFIHEIGLFEEETKPSEILIKAPAHICISDREMKIPVLYAARDQEGNIIPNMPGVSLVLENESDSIYLDDGYLYVMPDVKGGIYTLLAEGDNVSKKVSIEVSTASVGDGGFEKHSPGEWVSTADPSTLHFVDYQNYGFEGSGEKAARLTMGGNVSAVLSDSVYNFKGGQTYVFGATFMKSSGSMVILSLLLCDVEDVNYVETVPVLQTLLEDGKMKSVFTPPRDMAARLMLGFTDEANGQTLFFDDLCIEKATVYCDGVKISGNGYVGHVITGKYSLYANFDAVDISTYRWLVSKEKNGVYIPIEGHNDKSLSILDDMVNSYIKLEITPVTLNGPVIGESVTSEPIYIEGDDEGYYENEYYDPDIENEDFDDENSESIIVQNTPKGQPVVDIYSVDTSKIKQFVDIENHWAKEDINIMNAASIVNGKKNQLFMPDDNVTRAEFAAFIARSLLLEALEYSGTFDDVKKHYWYSGAVEIVAKYAIANGVGDKMFLPDDPVTREQMAAMLMRAMAITGVSVEDKYTGVFGDDAVISDYAKEYVYAGVKAGIIKGFDDGEFKPTQTATRAEAVVMIKRMVAYVLDKQKMG